MTASATPHVIPSHMTSLTHSQNSIKPFHDAVRAQLTQDIDVLLAYANLPSPLADACRYVMTSQGKLVRPLLVASAFVSVKDYGDKSVTQSQAGDGDWQASVKDDTDYHMARRAALAVELLHSYSLVHDDLPCMDDDALRRGRPTTHIVFDEATALLTGDVLQTLAFEVLTAELPTFMPYEANAANQLLAIFAPRARRMVSGQMLDLNAEASDHLSQPDLAAIHRDKTGALIEAAMLMGGICASATAAQRAALQECAQHIGLAFQVQDDVLDVTMTTDTLGKPAGSDEKLDKATYVKLMGIDGATRYAQSLFGQGRAALSRTLSDTDTDTDTDTNNDALLALIEWLWARKK